MANQPDFRGFLDKVKLQISDFQRVLFPSKKATLSSTKRAKQSETADQFPGMLLEIGSELLITKEIVEIYRGLSNSLGRVVIIDQLATPPEESIKASAFGIQVYVDMKSARHMRAAYLSREEALT